MQPAVYNWKAQRRADATLQLRFKQSDGTYMNLTNWQVLAQVWDRVRATKFADFTTEYVDRTTGHVKLTLPFSSTTPLPNQCFYDVMLISPSGLRQYYIEGTLTLSEGYTAP